MAQQLHCPNPACKHIFSAQEVQSAELLKCPGCGQLFRFRPPGSAPPPRAQAKAAPLQCTKPPIAAPLTAPLALPEKAPRAVVPIAAPVAPVVKPAPTRSVDVESLDQPVALPEAEANPFAVPT